MSPLYIQVKEVINSLHAIRPEARKAMTAESKAASKNNNRGACRTPTCACCHNTKTQAGTSRGRPG
eukprot:8453260-Ditylum_brightwellii.AAC.1